MTMKKTARLVTALFSLPFVLFAQTTYTITSGTYPSGAGSVSGAGTYDAGEVVTLTATPAEGYSFLGWVGSQFPHGVSTDNPVEYEVFDNEEIKALFTKTKGEEDRVAIYADTDHIDADSLAGLQADLTDLGYAPTTFTTSWDEAFANHDVVIFPSMIENGALGIDVDNFSDWLIFGKGMIVLGDATEFGFEVQSFFSNLRGSSYTNNNPEPVYLEFSSAGGFPEKTGLVAGYRYASGDFDGTPLGNADTRIAPVNALAAAYDPNEVKVLYYQNDNMLAYFSSNYGYLGYRWIVPDSIDPENPNLALNLAKWKNALGLSIEYLIQLQFPLVANAGEDRTELVDAGQTLDITLFGNESSDGDGTIVSYDWSWTGGTVSGENPQLLGLGPGEYVFTLTVTDDDGYTDDDTVTINIKANSDSDLASDEWEEANGFDPTQSDLFTLDGDGDGVPDIAEIFQGTNRDGSEDSYGLQDTSADPENQTLNTQFRMSTVQTAVNAQGQWSCDMENWYNSGESDGNITVTIAETPDVGGEEYVIVEVQAQVEEGYSGCLFFRQSFTPNE